MKKVLNTLLVLALIFTIVSPVFAADLTTQQKFNELKATGVISGDANGNMLAVNSEMSRQQLAKIACQLQGVAPTPGVEIETFADDYKTDVWGFDQGWIQAAYTAGLMEGKGAYGFDATGIVTTAQLITVILRSMGLATDADKTKNPWYTDYITVAVDQGLVSAGTLGSANANYGDLVVQSYNSYKYNNPTPTELKVVRITVVDAKTLQVKFTQPVNPSSTDNSGALNKDNYIIMGKPLDTADTLIKSSDNKTITIKLGAVMQNYQEYDVVVQNIRSQDLSTAVPMYTQVISHVDLVHPTVSSVAYIDNVTVKVTFSEPMSEKGNIIIRDDAGIDKTIDFIISDLSADARSFTISMARDRVFNKVNYSMQILGACDLLGNIQTIDPFTATIIKNVTETIPPTLISIMSPNSNTLVIKYSEKISNPGTLAIGIGGIPLTIDLTPLTGNAVANFAKDIVTVTVPADNLNAIKADGVHNVTITNFTDANANLTAEQTKAVVIEKDDDPPVFVGSEVVDIGGIKYLVITFDESVLVSNFLADTQDFTNIIKLDSHGIESTTPTFASFGALATIYNPIGSAKVNAIKIDLSVVEIGTYTVTLPAGMVKDDLGNKNTVKRFSFYHGAVASDITKPMTTNVIYQTGDNNTIAVVFNENVDAASALNTANYTISGLAAFDAAVFIDPLRTVKLTLKSDAIPYTGNHLFSVANVKDLNGNAMLAYSTVQQLTENITPKINTAELTGADKITVTFSEPLASAPTATDLDIYIGSAKEAEIAWTIIQMAGTNAYIITLDNALNSIELNREIQVKTQIGNIIKDTAFPNSNAFVAQTITVIK